MARRVKKGNASFEISIDEGKLAIQTAPQFRRELSGLLTRIEHRAKELERPHSRTGTLVRRIKKDPIKGINQYRISGSVTANARHSKWVHDGTKRHIIRARNAKALRFFWKGHVSRTLFRGVSKNSDAGWVAFKQVHHPGGKPRPFLLEAAGIEVAAYRARQAASRRGRNQFS